MNGIATSLCMAAVTSTTLFLHGATSRVRTPEFSKSAERVACTFAATYQIRNFISRRTGNGNGFVDAAQSEINNIAVLCEQEQSDIKTMEQLTKEVQDLRKQIKDAHQQLKEASNSLSEFTSVNKGVSDSACWNAQFLAGNGAQMRRSIGSFFKKTGNDPKQDQAIERAKHINEKCMARQKIKETVHRLTTGLPKLQMQTQRKETDLASVKAGLPDKVRAIQAAKAKTHAKFMEIAAIFGGKRSAKNSHGHKSSRHNSSRHRAEHNL